MVCQGLGFCVVDEYAQITTTCIKIEIIVITEHDRDPFDQLDNFLITKLETCINITGSSDKGTQMISNGFMRINLSWPCAFQN